MFVCVSLLCRVTILHTRTDSRTDTGADPVDELVHWDPFNVLEKHGITVVDILLTIIIMYNV